MVSIKVLRSALKDLGKITNSEFALFDDDLELIAISNEKNHEKILADIKNVKMFKESEAASQEIGGINYFRIGKENVYVLLVNSKGRDGYIFGRIAVSEISHFLQASSEKMDKEEFYRDLINGRIIPGNLQSEATRLKIDINIKRIIYYIKTEEENILPAREILANIFSDNELDYILSDDNGKIVLVKSVDDSDDAEDIAMQIVSMINTELMTFAKVTYSSTKNKLGNLNEAYNEATAAMEIADIFFEERKTLCYSSLGIGRIIKEMPAELGTVFLKEIFGENYENSLNDEEKILADIFMDNNLSIADTSRTMNIPRSTLIYRIDKLKKKTGLDIRVFNDALTLKIAIMVSKYRTEQEMSNKRINGFERGMRE